MAKDDVLPVIAPPEGAAKRIARNMILTFEDNWLAYLQILRAAGNYTNPEWREVQLRAAELVAAQMV